MNNKKLCKIICALCLAVPILFFVLAGNFTLAAVSSVAVHLVLCGVMMIVMMKMMGCKEQTPTEQDATAEAKEKPLS
ncbi:DUF2933 domain-containing protein [Vibrio sp. T187]|uniref:DUF2933 domain-containing protein n=1 Tax=Vibrio TaxID=662 RepID=UPI0010C9C838|nr:MULTISPECIES: DUF2933 domain-containing protein [Vibrio]MBW3695363.1 DUF2933 domain-containing protein [Vibrio sp. T187]